MMSNCQKTYAHKLLHFFYIISLYITSLASKPLGAGIPLAPFNVTVLEIYEDGVHIGWMLHPSHVAGLEISFTQLDDATVGQTQTQFIIQVEGTRTNYLMSGLKEETHYEVFIKSYSPHGIYSNFSEKILFKTTPGNSTNIGGLQVHPFEVLIVVAIVIAWFCAMALFWHKWNKIRISNPVESRFKFKPKNLDTIKVVKRSTDSVIHRSYSKSYNKTLAAREKHLARMNTMPAIKLDLNVLQDIVPNKSFSLNDVTNVEKIQETPVEKNGFRKETTSKVSLKLQRSLSLNDNDDIEIAIREPLMKVEEEENVESDQHDLSECSLTKAVDI